MATQERDLVVQVHQASDVMMIAVMFWLAHAFRASLACLWQTSGRSNLPFEQWIKMDLQYTDNWSPWLDPKIFARTEPVVVTGLGAH